MLEIGKLTSKVDRLIDDVHGHGEKIDTVRHQLTFVRGVMWVIAGLIVIGGAILTLYLNGKIGVSITPGH